MSQLKVDRWGLLFFFKTNSVLELSFHRWLITQSQIVESQVVVENAVGKQIGNLILKPASSLLLFLGIRKPWDDNARTSSVIKLIKFWNHFEWKKKILSYETFCAKAIIKISINRPQPRSFNIILTILIWLNTISERKEGRVDINPKKNRSFLTIKQWVLPSV